MADDVGKVTKILEDNKNLNFVQRIMKPDTSPVLVDYAGPGTHGTHLMSSGEMGGKGIVYPEIVQKPDGNLTRLGRREAMDHAVKTGEHIKFDTPKEAEWFGQNYKNVWGGQPVRNVGEPIKTEKLP
jgi:hypothetical protein